MPELPVDMWKPAATILYGILCAALGIIGYFLRDIRQGTLSKHSAQDKKIECIEKDFGVLRESLPRIYVLRDDFIRSIAGLDNKVDNIYKEVGEINKGLNQLIGGVKE